jgi:predicted DNA-binding protein (UPF0251 family)
MADIRLTANEIRAVLRAVDDIIGMHRANGPAPKALVTARDTLWQTLQRAKRSKVIEMKLVRGKPPHGARS